jgi:hypothetical protein
MQNTACAEGFPEQRLCQPEIMYLLSIRTSFTDFSPQLRATRPKTEYRYRLSWAKLPTAPVRVAIKPYTPATLLRSCDVIYIYFGTLVKGRFEGLQQTVGQW